MHGYPRLRIHGHPQATKTPSPRRRSSRPSHAPPLRVAATGARAVCRFHSGCVLRRPALLGPLERGGHACQSGEAGGFPPSPIDVASDRMQGLRSGRAVRCPRPPVIGWERVARAGHGSSRGRGEEARAVAVSIDRIRSATRYVFYLQVDDGDLRGTLAHPVKSQWVGEGAKALGYTGLVETRALRAVLRGWVRDGPQGGDVASPVLWEGGGAANGNTARGLTSRFRRRSRSRSWHCWAATDGSWPRSSGPCVARSSGSRRNWSRPGNRFRRPGRRSR